MLERLRSPVRGAAVLAAVAGLVASAGCDPATMARLDRQWNRRYPSDYNQTPLGASYDTQPEVNQIQDENLRNLMTEWLGMRKDYLRLWRERGGYDQEVARIRHRLASLRAVIQHIANQYGMETG